MARCDHVFQAVRGGSLPSAAFARLADVDSQDLRHLRNLDGTGTSASMERMYDHLSSTRSVGPFNPRFSQLMLI